MFLGRSKKTRAKTIKHHLDGVYKRIERELKSPRNRRKISRVYGVVMAILVLLISLSMFAPRPQEVRADISLENTAAPVDFDAENPAIVLTVTNADLVIVHVTSKDGIAATNVSDLTDGNYTQAHSSGDSGDPPRIDTWYLANPTAETKVIRVTIAACKGILGAFGLIGTYTPAPISATAGSTGGVTSATNSIITNYDNSWIVSAIAEDAAETLGEDGSQTSIWELIISGAPANRRGAEATREEKASAGNDTQSWTLGKAANWAISSVEVRKMPDIAVDTTGTQVGTMDIPSTNNYVGGAFTFTRDIGSTTVASIKITETGSVDAQDDLSNLDLYYEEAVSCSYEGTETLFGTAQFGVGDVATVIGLMTVDTDQTCVYAVLDVDDTALNNDELDIQISNPSTEVLAFEGTVSPNTPKAISGTTILSTGNNNPNDPSSLVQKKIDDTVLNTGDWTDETSVKFTATVSDPDNPEVLYLCVEKDNLATAFSDTEDLCGSGVAYTGTPVTATVTITGIGDAEQYHWQARVKDDDNAYSNWVSYDVNPENERDFGVDTTAPTGGTAYDGDEAGVDKDWNGGSLTQMHANWDSFDSSVSGLDKYQYGFRRKSDDWWWNTATGWQSGSYWIDNGLLTTATLNSLDLDTSDNYYFTVRAWDKAGNDGSPVNSDGQRVLPTLSFSLNTTSITFNNLNPGNNHSDTKTSTVTTSTNAYNGYSIYASITQLLTSSDYPAYTIPNFADGSYGSPAAWPPGQCTGTDCGFGYTSSDTTIGPGKINKFGSDGSHGTLWAPFSLTPPGDVVADWVDNIDGQPSGPLVNDSYTIDYKVATLATQASTTYYNKVTYIVTAIY